MPGFQVYISAKAYVKLAYLAEKSKVKIGQLVREAIDQFLEVYEDVKEERQSAA